MFQMILKIKSIALSKTQIIECLPSYFKMLFEI
jgi:hypothetical protein